MPLRQGSSVAALANIGLGTPSLVTNMLEVMAIEVHQLFIFLLRITDIFVDAIAAGFICHCFSKYRTQCPIGHQRSHGAGGW